ncbi:MAG TPA: adenosylcobinamide-GDP ribazoletransferase [Xanthobacteraceae bacterium]|nr:adenosylcobinamide-GDP ribazoletransferase [Xanthobacteraceae bacterium]
MIGLARRLARDVAAAAVFYTRIPLPRASSVVGADIARAGWAAPLVGAAIGLAGAAIYALAHKVGLPPLVAAGLTLASTLGLTGALHEDGFADTADGLGGATREQALAIMRDSRLGTFGACALTLSLLLRAGALASLGDPLLVTPAMVAAHAAARAMIPAFMRVVPQARADGLAAGAGVPPWTSVVAAALLGLAALLLLAPARGAMALLAMLLATAALARLCLRRIAGQTGDVLGAVEQVNEITVLLTAAARLG